MFFLSPQFGEELVETNDTPVGQKSLIHPHDNGWGSHLFILYEEQCKFENKQAGRHPGSVSQLVPEGD